MGNIVTTLTPTVGNSGAGRGGNQTYVVSSEAEMLALTQATIGDLAIRTDLRATFILKALPSSILTNWEELPTPPDRVLSVFGEIGNIAAKSGQYTTDLVGEGNNKYFTNIRALNAVQKVNNPVGFTFNGGTTNRALNVSVNCNINQDLAVGADVRFNKINLASAGNFNFTNGISGFSGNNSYTFGFDSVGGTRGYWRLNVDSKESAIHGLTLSGGNDAETLQDYFKVTANARVIIGTKTTLAESTLDIQNDILLENNTISPTNPTPLNVKVFNKDEEVYRLKNDGTETRFLTTIDNNVGFTINGGINTNKALNIAENCTINQDLAVGADVVFNSLTSNTELKINAIVGNRTTTNGATFYTNATSTYITDSAGRTKDLFTTGGNNNVFNNVVFTKQAVESPLILNSISTYAMLDTVNNIDVLYSIDSVGNRRRFIQSDSKDFNDVTLRNIDIQQHLQLNNLGQLGRFKGVSYKGGSLDFRVGFHEFGGVQYLKHIAGSPTANNAFSFCFGETDDIPNVIHGFRIFGDGRIGLGNDIPEASVDVFKDMRIAGSLSSDATTPSTGLTLLSEQTFSPTTSQYVLRVRDTQGQVLDVNCGIVASISASTTIERCHDTLLVNSSAGAIIITVSPLTMRNKTFKIFKVSSDTNQIAVFVSSGGLIGRNTPARGVITAQHSYMEFTCDNSNTYMLTRTV